MKPSLLVVGLSALVLASACTGEAHPRATATDGAETRAGAPPSAIQIPASPDRLPDPAQSSLPVGSKTLYTKMGHGQGGVTLPASAGKASSITVMWTCAGPSDFDIIATGKPLAASQCGDGTSVYKAEIPHAQMRQLTWKFAAADSVIWRIVVTQPPASDPNSTFDGSRSQWMNPAA